MITYGCQSNFFLCPEKYQQESLQAFKYKMFPSPIQYCAFVFLSKKPQTFITINKLRMLKMYRMSKHYQKSHVMY